INNRLKENGDKIKSDLLKELLNDEYIEPDSDHKSLTFELVDNEELEHKLLWQRATKDFEKNNNSGLINHINLALKNLYPDFKGSYPAMPDRICESFSAAITTLTPEKDIEEIFFNWFTSHLQLPVEELLKAIDKIIIERNLDVKSSPRQAPTPIKTQGQSSYNSSLNGSSLSTISTGSEPVKGNTELLDSFADQLVSRLEHILAEDAIMSEVKGNRVRTMDLTRILTSIQSNITLQNQSVENLHCSVTQALEHQGIALKLSRHHEDLINMIGWLFEFILEDHQLPEKIKKTIGLLQIPVLKEAIQDDSFLTNHDHPARILLNAITSAGIEHSTNLETGHNIFLLIEHTVRSIITNHCDNKNIFQEMLTEFCHNLNLLIHPEILKTSHSENNNSFIIEESLEEKTINTDLSWEEFFSEEPVQSITEEPRFIDQYTKKNSMLVPKDLIDDEPGEEIILTRNESLISEEDDIFFTVPAPSQIDSEIVKNHE
ncbi:MAG: DUF1631 family protein, partial [Endozoicomonas sp.]